MPFQELGAKSADGKGVLTVIPYVKPDGDPAVMIIIKKNVDGVFDTTLDGQPAMAAAISEDKDGSGNGPWMLGDLLVSSWEQAKKLANKK
jgi:hypothetical protein